tara:strand:+ start:341 stop:445 length:105 start_codon:yes stop_codon:yes gene_type:complete
LELQVKVLVDNIIFQVEEVVHIMDLLQHQVQLVV